MTRVLIIGGGLSGLTAAATLCSTEEVEITLLEQGPRFDLRDGTGRGLVEGLGGAGTRAGGKLCFPPASSGAWAFGDWTPSRFSSVLRETGLAESDSPFSMTGITPSRLQLQFGQYPSMLITRESLASFIRKLVERIESSGSWIETDTRVTSVRKTGSGEGFLVEAQGGTEASAFSSDYVVVATGRSSASQIRQLLPPGTDIVDNAPDLGLRVSMPYAHGGPFFRVGKDTKIKRRYGQVGVRTFCVCSRGESTQVEVCGLRYFDGHYGSALTDMVDFGILARDERLRGFKIARLFCSEARKRFEGIVTLAGFIDKVERCGNTGEFGPLFEALARFASELDASGWLSAPLDECAISIPSVDRLNPHVMTDTACETNIKGLYVIGDALGVSRGFLQSIWLGCVAAEEILASVREARLRIAV